MEDYIAAMARRRTARRQREPKPRTQPAEPRFSLSTLPFLLLIAALGLLGIAIMVAAWPGGWPQPRPSVAAPHELGTAPPDWFEKAKREFR